MAVLVEALCVLSVSDLKVPVRIGLPVSVEQLASR